MRIARVSIVIFAAILCAWLSACASPSKGGGVISAAELERGLVHQLPSLKGRVLLEDESYRTVTIAEMWAAVNVGWMPWKAEAWDCDDQAAGILHALRVRYRDSGAAPAAGRMTVTLRGRGHCVVWWVSDAGSLRFLDPSTLRPLDRRLLSQPRNVTDK